MWPQLHRKGINCNNFTHNTPSLFCNKISHNTTIIAVVCVQGAMQSRVNWVNCYIFSHFRWRIGKDCFPAYSRWIQRCHDGRQCRSVEDDRGGKGSLFTKPRKTKSSSREAKTREIRRQIWRNYEEKRTVSRCELSFIQI